jgi:hypothetical protein
MKKITATEAPVPWLGEDWFDPLEAGVRQHLRSFIEAMLESELEAVLNRGRYERAGPTTGHRHGHRDRQILGTLARRRCRCRGPGWPRPTVRPGNGATGRCPPTSV